MIAPRYAVGDLFPIQFAWRLPDGDYLRAVFEAQVLDHVAPAEKYVVILEKLIAGRQENPEGGLRETAEFSRDYWALVGNLVGRKITVAYEVDDGRALRLRLETLSGEHNFFHRYGLAEDTAQKLERKWRDMLSGTSPPAPIDS